MPTISVTDEDFNLLFGAANDAYELGDLDAAQKLDKLARKMNAALSNRRVAAEMGIAGSLALTWEDCPSVLVRRQPQPSRKQSASSPPPATPKPKPQKRRRRPTR